MRPAPGQPTPPKGGAGFVVNTCQPPSSQPDLHSAFTDMLSTLKFQ